MPFPIPEKHRPVARLWVDGIKTQVRRSETDAWVYAGDFPTWEENLFYRAMPVDVVKFIWILQKNGKFSLSQLLTRTDVDDSVAVSKHTVIGPIRESRDPPL